MMRVIMISRAVLVVLGLLATVSVAACSATPAPSNTGPGNGQSATPAASTTPSAAASPTAAAPSATPNGTGAVQNLVITSAERNDLRAAFLAYKGVSTWVTLVIGPIQGSVYFAYDPGADTYWAMALFWAQPEAINYLPNFDADFRRGGGDAMFKKVGAAGSWQVQSAYCPRSPAIWQFFPPAVLNVWSISTTVPLGPTDLGGAAC